MNFIHPTAVIGPNVVMGNDNYIGPFCIIGYPAEHKDFWGNPVGQVIIGNNNKFTGHVTVDAGTDGTTVIGNDNWFLKHSHVGHDAIITSRVTVSCGAKIGGHACLYGGVNIGLNAVIHQRQRIREGCMIGMGAVVTKGLITEPYKTYAGNPAKLIGENTKHPDYPEYTINMKETL
jgi:UDP-N-acetylglucosamine acyltransferase